MVCNETGLGFGGGGSGGGFAFFVDADLAQGTAAPSPTFRCPVIASNDVFEVLGVEVWRFHVPGIDDNGSGGGGVEIAPSSASEDLMGV